MSDESARLEALYEYKILDTDSEPEFDALTRLISEICETPTALVSLIDENRQWFKSRIGLEAKETSRDIAFCHHAIQGEDVYEINDTLADKKFKSNPLVTGEPNIRFYAGTPLKSYTGHNIGTLCVIDNKPRTLNDFQRRALSTLGNQVIAQMELRKKMRELKQHQDSLIQTEKLASLGRMAGGIAHELNNPLQVLNNYLELVLSRARKIGHKDDFADVVKNSKNTIFRMARIIQTMLGFVKTRRILATEEITLLHLTDDTQLLLSERLVNFTGDFKINWGIDNQLLVNCNPIEVSQVLINLISNALDACKDQPKPEVNLNIENIGTELVFTVTDNGDGIPDDVLKMVKEPFFTTKEVGQGTGLGLFICHQVAERMNGTLDYERKDDLTHFHLKIPFSAPQ